METKGFITVVTGACYWPISCT